MKILIVCSSGIGTSAMLKAQLEETVPEHQYLNCGIRDVAKMSNDVDLVLTFESLKDAVLLEVPEQAVVKTIEGFNAFVSEQLKSYLSR